jgi:hypothetical protein
MSDLTWAKLRVGRGLSWHVVSIDHQGHTLCGRIVPVGSPTKADLPPLDKSCENCLRLTVKAEEAQAVEQRTDHTPWG